MDPDTLLHAMILAAEQAPDEDAREIALDHLASLAETPDEPEDDTP